MTLTTRILAETATAIGLLPLAWLSFRHALGKSTPSALWWIAAAFGVSWLADTLASWANPAVISIVYPVSQAGVIGLVLLQRRDAQRFLALMVAVAVVSILWQGVTAPDVLLRSVAWGGVVGMAVHSTFGRLRWALAVYFGLGLIAWVWYAALPGWPSWLGYQGTRLAGLLAFCGAVEAE